MSSEVVRIPSDKMLIVRGIQKECREIGNIEPSLVDVVEALINSGQSGARKFFKLTPKTKSK